MQVGHSIRCLWSFVERRLVVLTITAWCFVRLVQWGSGATFSDAYLDYGWQMVPREVLRRDVLGSVWYLHTQPPLYNLVIGTILRVSPLSDAISVHVFILGCSLLAAVGLHKLAVLFGFSGTAAAVLVTVLMADPYMIRYELEPTYEIPALAMVVWSLVLLHRAAFKPTVARFAAASGLLTAVVLTRSLFHPLWLATALALLALSRTHAGWRAIAVAVAIPVVGVGAWVVKNEVVFGDATLSSWLGMNLERGAIAPLDRESAESMVADGAIDEIATVPPFDYYESYAPFVEPCVPTHNHPAVANPLRPNGFADYNFECFIPVYSVMFDASVAAIKSDPGAYLSSRLDALRFSFDHVEEAGYGKSVLSVLRPLYRVAFIDVRSDIDMTDWLHPLFGPGMVIVYPSIMVGIAVVVCGAELWRRLGRIRRRTALPTDLLVAVSAFTGLWVVVTGAILEMGENARFRAMVHPVIMLVAVALVRDAWNSRSPRQASADEPASSSPSVAS